MSPLAALRKRLEYVPGMHRPHPVRDGVIMLVVLGVLLYCGFSRSVPFWPKGGSVVTAHFDNAANAIPGNQVRVKGVEVGRVESVARDPSGHGADVKMRIHEDGFKVTKDAHAALLWRTLLGRNLYIDLDPGDQSAPGIGDDKIPLSHTQTQVEFDQLLDSYDERGRQGVRTFFKETDHLLDGPQVGTAIEHLGPGLAPVAPAMRAFRGSHPGDDLPTIVKTGAQAVKALSADEAALAGIIDHGDTTLAVTAARRADLGGILQKAPPTMREARATLTRLRTTLNVLDPIASRLRPGVRELPAASTSARNALEQVRALTPTAVPALRDLQPALARLREASEQGGPLLTGLGPTLDRLKDQIIPFLNKTDATTGLKNFQAIGPFFSVLDSSSAQYDANGHMQRFQAGQGERSVGLLPCNTGLFDPETKKQLAECTAAMRTLPQLLRGGVEGGGALQGARIARKAAR
jgi:virulence factor Mce-like protein